MCSYIFGRGFMGILVEIFGRRGRGDGGRKFGFWRRQLWVLPDKMELVYGIE